jgi:hypothetical protein
MGFVRRVLGGRKEKRALSPIWWSVCADSLGFRVEGLQSREYGLEFGVQGEGTGLRVEGSGV